MPKSTKEAAKDKRAALRNHNELFSRNAVEVLDGGDATDTLYDSLVEKADSAISNMVGRQYLKAGKPICMRTAIL